MNVVRESLFGFQPQVHLWCKPFVKGFLFCTHSIRFCRGSTERGWDEQGVWHGWGTREISTGFWWENL